MTASVRPDEQSSEDLAGCPRHEWRVLGRLSPDHDDVHCDFPKRAVCVLCSRVERWACRTSRESVCVPCSSRYKRVINRLALEGAHRRVSGYHYLLTLTAPGTRRHYRPGTRNVCPCWSGEAVDLGKWNAAQGAKWNHFRTAARRYQPSLEFFRTVELQKRGALHVHAMCWSPTPLSESTLREYAMAAGFGCQVKLDQAPPGSRHFANYVAKYVTKAADLRRETPWTVDQVDLDTGEITAVDVDGRYRIWSQSRSWGPSMAIARAAHARSVARAKAGALDLEEPNWSALSQDALRAIDEARGALGPPG